MKAILLLLFALSGAAGLAYEVAWTRSMIFVLGNTNLAMGLVLAVFLLGFFFGSAAASAWMRERSALLRRYAWVEVGIGILGLLFPLLMGWAKDIYPVLARWTDPDAARVAVCIVFLSLPTFLMGATFPLMNGLFITQRERAGRGAGLIYGAQTLGAACGAALAGFVLLRHFGLAGTSWITAGANFAVALTAVVLSLMRGGVVTARSGASPLREEAGQEAAPPVEDEPQSGIPGDQGIVPFVMAVLFCSGFSAFALEILWTRILVFFIDGITYSFTAMLVVYLLALAAGSGILSVWDRLKPPGLAAGGLVLILGGLAAVASLLWIPELYDLTQAAKGDPAAYGFGGFIRAAIAGSGVILFLPALLIGMATPMAIGILVRHRGNACRFAGLAYASSCLGCCCGALAASWFLVTWLGLLKGVVLAGMLTLTAGVLLFNISRTFWLFKLTVSLGPLFVVYFIALQVIQLPHLVTESHVFKRPGRQGTIHLQGYAEGNVCTASVILDSRNREQRLYTDGFNAASTGPEYGYMRMMAHLPAMACPDPGRALVIGYGTGTTAGSLALHEEIGELDIVEISPAVMALAGLFRQVNRGVGLGGPPVTRNEMEAIAEGQGQTAEQKKVPVRIRVHTDMDGRDFLNLSAEGYDVITLEPLMPYTPAAVHFYTAEFYELCLEKLCPGGVVCQWVPLNAMPVEDLELLLGTFAAAIPASGFFSFENSVLLLGFAGDDWALDPGRIDSFFEDEALQDDLAIAGVTDAAAVFGAFVCDGARMRELTADAGVMWDDLTPVEYVRIAPGAEAFRRMADGFDLLSRAQEPIGKHLSLEGLSPDETERLEEAVASYRLSFRYLLKGLQAEAAQAYDRLFSPEGAGRDDPGRYFEKAFNLNPNDYRAARKHALALVRKANGLILAGRFAEARRTLHGASLHPHVDLFELLVAEALLALAGGDTTGLERIMGRMELIKPHTNMESALQACLFRLDGDLEKAEEIEERIEQRGGLAPLEKRLLAVAYAEAIRGGGAGSIERLDQVLQLLKAGPLGVTPRGTRAWGDAAEADEDLLDKARRRLLEQLAAEGFSEPVVRGLAYFKSEEVVEALRGIYIGASMDQRPSILDALYRAGDRETFLQVLGSGAASTDLLLKATEIAAQHHSSAAVPLLIDLLEHRSEIVRVGAFVALYEITNMRFGYDPYAGAAERAAAVEQWRAWYTPVREENR